MLCIYEYTCVPICILFQKKWWMVKYIFVQIWFSFSHFSAKKHLFSFRKKIQKPFFFNSVQFSITLFFSDNYKRPDIFLTAFNDNYSFFIQSNSVYLKCLPCCIIWWWVIKSMKMIWLPITILFKMSPMLHNMVMGNQIIFIDFFSLGNQYFSKQFKYWSNFC